MIPDAWINWAVLAMMITVVVFKFLLWRLTRFWPFLVFVAAFVYVAATRISLIKWTLKFARSATADVIIARRV